MGKMGMRAVFVVLSCTLVPLACATAGSSGGFGGGGDDGGGGGAMDTSQSMESATGSSSGSASSSGGSSGSSSGSSSSSGGGTDSGGMMETGGPPGDSGGGSCDITATSPCSSGAECCLMNNAPVCMCVIGTVTQGGTCTSGSAPSDQCAPGYACAGPSGGPTECYAWCPTPNGMCPSGTTCQMLNNGPVIGGVTYGICK